MLGFNEVIKAQVTQSLLTAMLENAGYRVSRLGVEERLAEIKYLDKHRYDALRLPVQLRLLPDLLVTDQELTVAHLVEVKHRSYWDRQTIRGLCERLQAQLSHWPGMLSVVFLSEPLWDERCYIQDHVRACRASDISMLRDDTLAPSTRWDRLPLLHHVLPGLKCDDYLTRADGVTHMVMALGDM